MNSRNYNTFEMGFNEVRFMSNLFIFTVTTKRTLYNLDSRRLVASLNCLVR